MCEATVYRQRRGHCEKVMEDVIRIESAGTEVIVSRLFEAPQTVKGEIRKVDFLNHRVVLAMQRADR